MRMRLEYRILERTICQGDVPHPPSKVRKVSERETLGLDLAQVGLDFRSRHVLGEPRDGGLPG